MQKIRPDMDIGHNIQRLRRNTNMTQDHSAKFLIPISLNSFSDYFKSFVINCNCSRNLQ